MAGARSSTLRSNDWSALISTSYVLLPVVAVECAAAAGSQQPPLWRQQCPRRPIGVSSTKNSSKQSAPPGKWRHRAPMAAEATAVVEVTLQAAATEEHEPCLVVAELVVVSTLLYLREDHHLAVLVGLVEEAACQLREALLPVPRHLATRGLPQHLHMPWGDKRHVQAEAVVLVAGSASKHPQWLLHRPVVQDRLQTWEVEAVAVSAEAATASLAQEVVVQQRVEVVVGAAIRSP